jgi:hypothetical protein
MNHCNRRRLGVCLALALGLCPFLVRASQVQPRAADKTGVFIGNVVPLSGPLEKFGARLDPQAAPYWLALVTKEGKTYPLIADDGARLFYKDAALRNRPMRLTGRLFADTHLLQVLGVQSYKNGRLHDVYYWCDICSIRRSAPGKCECCGGPMQLREVPVK